MERSRKLQRQMKKSLGHEEADRRFVELADLLRDKHRMLYDLYGSVLRGIPAFLSSIDDVYAQYEERISIALRNLELSSGELNEANHTLESLNVATNAMLDSLGQGFLFFDENGLCSGLFSKASIRLLETVPTGKNIMDILRLGEEERRVFMELLRVLYTRKTQLSFEEVMALAPRFYRHSRGFEVTLDYRPVMDQDGRLSRIVLIATLMEARASSESP